MAGFDLTSLMRAASMTTGKVAIEGRRTQGVSLDLNNTTKVKNDSLPSFKEMLAKALDTVNDLQINADRMAQKVATGEVNDVHEVLMAVEEVSLGLQLTMQIRNKIIEAYQEIMRMQI